MPLNAPIKDRVISQRHLTSQGRFNGSNLSSVSNVTTDTTPPSLREIIPVVAISLTNITLSGPQTIDGVSITAGMAVLANGQTDKTKNGPYICQSGAWTRISDFNMVSGLLVVVRQGTANANTVWMESLEFDIYTPEVTELEWINVVPVVDPPDPIEYEDVATPTVTVTVDNVAYEISAVVNDGSIDTIHIANLAVTTAKIDNGAVTTSKIQDAAITTDKLADDAVSTAKIQLGAVTEPKLAALSVSTTKIQDSAVTNPKIANGSVGTPKIADDAVTNEKMADDSVGANELLVVNDDGFIDFYDGTGSPVEQGIRVVQEKIGNHYEMNSFTGNLASLITNWTFRFPADNTKAYPPGIYHVDIRALVQAFVVARRVRNVQAFSMEVAVGGGARTVVDRSDQHADPASGVHNFFVNTLRGGLLLDITDSTTANRYVEVFVDLNITDTTVPGTADRSSVQGYFHIHKLNDASSTIVQETI